MSNTSGLRPIEFNVVVKQDAVEDKTAGGLMKPLELVERERHAQTRGTIIAVSDFAFNEDIYPATHVRPRPGQRCVWARHAGVLTDGSDGEEYRVIKDKDVVAIIEAE